MVEKAAAKATASRVEPQDTADVVEQFRQIVESAVARGLTLQISTSSPSDSELLEGEPAEPDDASPPASVMPYLRASYRLDKPSYEAWLERLKSTADDLGE